MQCNVLVDQQHEHWGEFFFLFFFFFFFQEFSFSASALTFTVVLSTPNNNNNYYYYYYRTENVDRNRFGKTVTHLGPGDSFGEAATEDLHEDEEDGSVTDGSHGMMQPVVSDSIGRRGGGEVALGESIGSVQTATGRKKKKRHPNRRNASIITLTGCSFLVLEAETYYSLVVSHGFHLARILNTCTILSTPPENRMKSEMQELLKLSKKNAFLRQLPETAQHDLCATMMLKTSAPGDVVMLQGAKGKNFYIVLSGSIDVRIHHAEEEEKEKEEEQNQSVKETSPNDNNDSAAGGSKKVVVKSVFDLQKLRLRNRRRSVRKVRMAVKTIGSSNSVPKKYVDDQNNVYSWENVDASLGKIVHSMSTGQVRI